MSELTQKELVAIRARAEAAPPRGLGDYAFQADRDRYSLLAHIAALTEKLASPTPLQAAALAALVAWRVKGKAFGSATPHETKQELADEFSSAIRDLRAIADALIAAEGGTG